ncbi:hypothetical protein ONZ43_g4939 [Nemania bipapillata]|uniref:Uncharacterized protein n=1 Tax=Nemania bipapillata TaxID=110536 RepID=A0ACC2IGF6_9PEZI|nr:hypothetical protein ONZ43_g4939 [Nemania bipapillata]
MATFIEATDQLDPRIPDVKLSQPWRQWWPPNKTNTGELSSPDCLTPWVSWRFDHDQRFRKPWVDWPMNEPSNYASEKPRDEPGHDEAFIQKEVERQGPDPKIDPSVPRTSSFVQFFGAGPNYTLEKPYASKIPPSNPDTPQINFGGVYHKIMMSDTLGLEDHFSLDVDGFKFEPGAYQGPTETFEISAYLDHTMSWLKNHLGCSEVFVFDYTLRHEKSAELKMDGFTGVARRIHCGM